ncbi:MAG: DUF503 domain-containing protein [Anaerolineae bacterium]|jgi:hypothetical protein|nr:MAG: DUF503 domain-containing protein [Anaerolineae bacterium]
MIVGTCSIELHLPGVQSLKEKRSIVKSLIAQIQKKFNAAAAEVGFHDVWQSSTIGVAVVSTHAVHANQWLENIVDWIEHYRPDVDVIEHNIETIRL